MDKNFAEEVGRHLERGSRVKSPREPHYGLGVASAPLSLIR